MYSFGHVDGAGKNFLTFLQHWLGTQVQSQGQAQLLRY